ncbi:NUDIX domain-containing protein [Candidatus Woesearchaeota archaeon]|nr:NUDIX domain-containing protein [Candidatus Woesearchaeota archaeon]
MGENELIDVIDEQEHIIKTIPKSQVRKEKNTQPNKWDITVGGWVLAGEFPERAAYRETEEEIGAENVKLTFLLKYKFAYNNEQNMISYLYKTVYNGNIIPQIDEVQAFEWVNLNDLAKIKTYYEDTKI